MRERLLLRPSYVMLLFFFIAQFLALYVGKYLIDQQEYFAAMRVVERPEELVNVVYFATIIVVAALIFLIILIFPFRDIIIRILEFVATTAASAVVFFVILTSVAAPNADAYSIVLAILLYGTRLIIPLARSALAIISSAGVGALIGFSIDPLPATLFVVAVIVYDILAVWWTRHMVQLAQYFVRMRTAFTLTAVGTRERKIRRRGKIFTKAVPAFLELGTGDLAVPAILCVAMYKIGLTLSLATLFGAAIGLTIVLRKAEEERKIFPAMPWVGGCALVMLLIVYGLSLLFSFL